jgi:hypothetical protein
MTEFLADLGKRLSSRKFLLAVAAAATLMANRPWLEAVAVIATYLGIEGVGDAVERHRAPDRDRR